MGREAAGRPDEWIDAGAGATAGGSVSMGEEVSTKAELAAVGAGVASVGTTT